MVTLLLNVAFAQILDQGGTKVRGARKAQFAVYYGF